MKTSIKTFVYAFAASIVFFSCNINNIEPSIDPNNALLLALSSSSLSGEILCTEGMPVKCYICTDTDCYPTDTDSYYHHKATSSSSSDSSLPPSIIEIPAMDIRVVSYKRPERRSEDYAKLSYRNGFTTDKDILKFWFPDIFSKESAKECNYFALYFTGSSSGLSNSYEILSQDMVLYRIGCTWRGQGVETTDFDRRAMLICDDNAGTLRKTIDLDSMHFYNDPGWECESDEGGPNWEEIYF